MVLRFVCVCVSQGGGERQREYDAGSRVKGGAGPGGARGSQQQSGGQEGLASDGGPCFNRDVRCDKDKTDRPVEWSCADRVVYPHRALCRCHAPRSPLSHSCRRSYCFNLFHLLFHNAVGQFHVSQLDVCVHSRVMSRRHLNLRVSSGKGVPSGFKK